jgi:antibiotic biosynthesis monooxygenase (ABM) superfamily enzyme
MIFVHIQHFLNDDGQRHFHEWLTQIANALSGFDGFIRVRQLTKVDHADECHLMLEFETLEQLRKWSASAEQKALIEQLAPFTLRAWESDIYEVGRLWTVRKDGDAYLT